MENIEPTVTTDDKQMFSDEEMANLRVIKLNNGEELMAVILAMDDKHMLVRRPCKISRIATDVEGNVAILLLKWQPFSDQEKHAIVADQVLSYARVTETVAAFYLKSVMNQIHEELQESLPEGFEWPQWMDDKIPSAKLN
jgi:hypothetical protein